MSDYLFVTPEYKLVTLPPPLMQEWLKTKSALQWTQPAFTSTLYQMMNQDGGESVFWFTMDIPTLAIDGRRIWCNPAFFFRLPMAKRIAAGCHEILHGVLRHMEQAHAHLRNSAPVIWQGKSVPFDLKRCYWAMDYVVNAILVEAQVGEIDDNWLYDPQIATAMTPWQEAYHKMDWQQPQQQGQSPQPSGNQGQPPGQGQAPGQGQPQPQQQGPDDTPRDGPQDRHETPGKSQDKAPDDPGVQASEEQWKMAIKQAEHAAELAGVFPGTLKKLFGELLVSTVPWQDHVQGILARGLGGGGYNYRRPDRRLIIRDIYAPARSGKGCNTIVIGADSSGSIYGVDGLIDKIFSETVGILDQIKPRRIIVVWCDSKVQRVDDVVDTADIEIMREQGAAGGGGTKFAPVFRWIADNAVEPDALIYFTDGESTDRDRLTDPDYPVIWGHIGEPEVKYPFGERVDIPHSEYDV